MLATLEDEPEKQIESLRERTQENPPFKNTSSHEPQDLPEDTQETQNPTEEKNIIKFLY